MAGVRRTGVSAIVDGRRVTGIVDGRGLVRGSTKVGVYKVNYIKTSLWSARGVSIQELLRLHASAGRGFRIGRISRRSGQFVWHPSS